MMNAWKWGLIAALVCLLGLSFIISCDDDDDDSVDDDNDDDSVDDDNDDDDGDAADNPIPPDECEAFCTQANVDISNQCLTELGIEPATIEICLEQCLEGYVDQAIRTCLQNFVDCETYLECVAPYIGME